jgi:PAS domain S-box-containing protein
MEFFRQHNAVLFKKLETKMADLNQEIAQRTQTEAELRASEGRFRGLFEQSTTGIAVTGLDGEFLHLNLAFANMLGYTTEEMLQLDFAKVTHPDDVARSFKIFHALLDRVFENYRMEKRYIHKNGGIVWADVSMTLLFDSKGLPQYFIVGSVNITKRMKAELALREHYVLLQALIDSPNEFIIFSLDQQYRYTAFNARHAEEVRKSGRREPKIGIRILDLVDDENLRATLKGSMDRALSGESFIEVERLPESDAYYEFTWAPIPGQDGKPGGLTAFIRDITARRLIEERIRTINLELEDKVAERTAQLEASNRELEAFAYSISHDLRAPLRAIEGFTAILKSKYSERLAPEGQELMERISTGALQMNKLILDILAISKVTRIALEFSRIDMGAMVRQVLGELVPANNAGHISFIIGDLPEVEADPVLLKQVWSNLLSNAIKYSRTRERPDIELGGGTVGNLNAYWVKDNGVGFNPQQVHKLFGMFQRLHPATEFEGTGVGLAIVQRIIHRHGGQVRGESALGQGATFTFTLPGAAPGA